eukprot:3134715-Pleurochrysis_carterae.AAC.1
MQSSWMTFRGYLRDLWVCQPLDHAFEAVARDAGLHTLGRWHQAATSQQQKARSEYRCASPARGDSQIKMHSNAEREREVERETERGEERERVTSRSRQSSGSRLATSGWSGQDHREARALLRRLLSGAGFLVETQGDEKAAAATPACLRKQSSRSIDGSLVC